MTTPREDRQLRVLVLTNHFAEFAGSEVVALQAAQWFVGMGDLVTLAANVVNAPIMNHASGVRLNSAPETVELTAYDLIWCQHDLLSLLPISAYEEASRSGLPYVAYVSLSPYEPYEHLDGLLARALSAGVYANSPETADEIVARNKGVIAPSKIRVFHNAAPGEFWKQHDAPPASGELKSVLLISNHPPEELKACAALLEQMGVKTRFMGLHHEFGLLRPADVASVDAVVTIGKSVIYAIAQGKPVFVYDHFGGDGWLTRANFASNLHHNFSGRPNKRQLSADALAAELISGYGSAVREMAGLGEVTDLTAFRLDTHLAPLRQRALERKSGWRRMKLGFWLKQPAFRAHLSTLQKKSEVMRLLRLQFGASATLP